MNAPPPATQFASGKNHRSENFPVASWLLKPVHRAPIMAFYAFARTADDVADHPSASPAVKLARLDAMAASLDRGGDAEPAAARLRAVLAARGLDPAHARDLLAAFTRDVTARRYAEWDSLMAYCRLSAMPVGRFVLDVHGEDRATWPASDALCAALQIINHLQDCGADYRQLDRIYLPLDMLVAAAVPETALGAAAASPALRGVIAAAAGRCLGLLAASASLAPSVADRRLSVEIAVIHRLAVSLAERLRHRDPLGERVRHGRSEALALAGRAIFTQLRAR